MPREQVFISYSHADRALMEEFKTMLAPVLRQGQIVIWEDTQIQPGARWRDEIQSGLDAARVGLLLVSDNFLSSGFINNEEVPQLLKAAEQDGATIFWICLSPCLWQHSPVSDYQAANDPDKPLDQLSKVRRKAVWQDICQKLLKVAKGSAPQPKPAPRPAPRPPAPIPKPAPAPAPEPEPEPEPQPEPAPVPVKPRPAPRPKPPVLQPDPPTPEPEPYQPPTPQPLPQPYPNPQPAVFHPVGRWQIEVMALIHSTMTVDLYPNGTCQGAQQIPFVGTTPFQGAWQYDPYAHTLTMQGMVQFQPFLLVIQITGSQGNTFSGMGMDGVAYQFHRLG